MSKFQQFIKERKYLTNVTPRTLEWHEQSLKWLKIEDPTEADLKAMVVRMREAELKASSINCRLRSINAYLKWSGSSLKVPKLKEEQRVLPTFSAVDVSAFVKWKPSTTCERRLKLLILMLTDVGCRISEALDLSWDDVDFDNLLLTLTGKGRKQRKVPFSLELRKHLFMAREESGLVFRTSSGKKLSRRNALRDVGLLCQELGIKLPERSLHAFRHSFAVNYLRKGGGVFHLQRALGHSSLERSRRYANLAVEDLQAIHQKVSLLR